jgi:uncharacterized membrane protein YoaK (UPF0700 family)
VEATYLTGTVTETMLELARAVTGSRPAGTLTQEPSNFAPLALLWLIYFCAAAAAAYLTAHWATGAAFLSVPTLVPVMLRSRSGDALN